MQDYPELAMMQKELEKAEQQQAELGTGCASSGPTF